MTPETTATIRTAYVDAIPALEAIALALEAAKGDEDADERRRAVLMELGYARACGSALRREAVGRRREGHRTTDAPERA